MNLKPFCGKAKILSEPFSDDQYTYATDGNIIIRVPRQPKIRKKIPNSINLDVLSFDHHLTTSWIDTPLLAKSIPYFKDDNECIEEKYLEMIKDLPEIKFSARKRGIDEPIQFKFKGGIGLLMPVIK